MNPRTPSARGQVVDQDPGHRPVVVSRGDGIFDAVAATPVATATAATVGVEIVIPLCADRRVLESRVRGLHLRLARSLSAPWRITVLDSGDVEGAEQWAAALAYELPAVRVRKLRVRGHGAALRTVWRESEAEVVAFLDGDPVVWIDALLPLIRPLREGLCDLVSGSVPTRRPMTRDVDGAGRVSRTYQRLIRFVFGVDSGRSRTGMTAARRDAVVPLLGNVADDGCFFDTELLLLAEHNGLIVHRLPLADPVEGAPRAAVTRRQELAKLTRVLYAITTGRADAVMPKPAPRPVIASSREIRQPRAVTLLKFLLFGLVGALSGVLYVLVYLALRDLTSPALANFGALLVSALFNTEANRAWTFTRARVPRIGMHLRAAMLFAAHYVVTTGTVVVVLELAPGAGRTTEVVVLLAADLLMTVLRFIGLDRWVFRRGRD